MARKVISKKDDLGNLFPDYVASLPDAEVDAIDRFFKKGNILSVLVKEEEVSLIYPRTEFFLMRLASMENLYNDFRKRRDYWVNELKSIQMQEQTQKVKMLAHPLFWKHSVKKIVDSNYKKKADKVELPIHLVSDEKWKPMLETFIKDSEYRDRLSDTVENSIFYSDTKKLAQQAKDITEFKVSQSKRKIEEFQGKMKKLEHEIESYNAIQKFLKQHSLL